NRDRAGFDRANSRSSAEKAWQEIIKKLRKGVLKPSKELGEQVSSLIELSTSESIDALSWATKYVAFAKGD
ncbi:hypothetical protein, partial [Vibrio harveyi]